MAKKSAPAPMAQLSFLEGKGGPFTPNTDPMFNAQPRFWPGAHGGASYAGSLVWRSIDLLAGYVKMARTKWLAAGTEDDEAPKAVDLSPVDKVAALFKHPNLQMDWAEFRYACETYRYLGGYIVVRIGMDGRPTDKFPVSLLVYPLTNGWRRAVDGKPMHDPRDFYRGNSWRNETLSLTVRDEEAVVCKNFDPALRGNIVSQAGFAALAQNILTSTQQYQSSLLNNDNRPGVVVTTNKNIKEDNRARLQGEMMATYGGVVNAGRLMLLAGDGMDWKVSPVDPLKLTEISNKDHLRDIVRQVGIPFGIPEMVLVGNMDNANKANSSQIRANFLVDTVEPAFVNFERVWNSQFFEPLGLPVRLDLDQWSLSAFRDVAADRMELIRLRLETGDTPAEAYKFAGIPFTANEESDKPILSSTLGQIQKPEPVAVTPEGKPVVETGIEKPKDDRAAQDEAQKKPTAKKDLPIVGRKGFQSVQFIQAEIKRIHGHAELKRRAIAEQIFAKCVDPFEEAHKAATEKCFKHAKGETIRRLVTFLNTGHHLAKDARELLDRSLQLNIKGSPIIPGKSDLDGLLPDGDTLAGELRATWLSTFLDVGTASQTQMEKELGDISGWLSRGLEERRRPALDRLADSVQVSDTIRRDVKTTLTGILEAEPGATAQQIAKALRDGVDHVFQDAYARTTTIARTELSGVLSGYRDGIMAANGVKRIRWVTAGDAHVRDSHIALNGKETEIGKPFPGTNLKRPHDPAGSAADIINCRCVAVAA